MIYRSYRSSHMKLDKRQTPLFTVFREIYSPCNCLSVIEFQNSLKSTEKKLHCSRLSLKEQRMRINKLIRLCLHGPTHRWHTNSLRLWEIVLSRLALYPTHIALLLSHQGVSQPRRVWLHRRQADCMCVFFETSKVDGLESLVYSRMSSVFLSKNSVWSFGEIPGSSSAGGLHWPWLWHFCTNKKNSGVNQLRAGKEETLEFENLFRGT